MSRWEILKQIHKWESLPKCQGYFTLVLTVLTDRRPDLLDTLEARNIKDKHELWDAIMNDAI